MSRAVAWLACMAVLTAAPPVAAAPASGAGHLDHSFGKAGVAMTAFGVAGEAPAVTLGVAPDGSPIIVNNLEGTVVRFHADGAVDKRFASGGRLQVAPGFGFVGGDERRFFARSAAVDGAGRALVFGAISNGSRKAQGPEGVQISPSSAAVLRFTAAGRLDRSFGEGKGFFEGVVGIPPESSTGFARAEALAGTVDSQDRPVLVAGEWASAGGCYGKTTVEPQPRAVVRLTAAGQIDPSFGAGDGISPIGGSNSFPVVGIDAADQPAVGVGRVGSQSARCGRGTTIYRLGVSGEALAGFGVGGMLSFNRRHLSLVEPSGSVILSGQSGRTLSLARVAPDGSRDPSFGREGVGDVKLPLSAGLHVRPAAVDPAGRIRLVGFVGSPTSEPTKREPERSSFVVARLLPNGKLDRSFGKRGWIFTRLPAPLNLISATGVVDSAGRLVVGGIVTKPDHLVGAFAVARYVLVP